MGWDREISVKLVTEYRLENKSNQSKGMGGEQSQGNRQQCGGSFWDKWKLFFKTEIKCYVVEAGSYLLLSARGWTYIWLGLTENS